jgi:ABC-type Mn/Zn transport systems, ATPase component
MNAKIMVDEILKAVILIDKNNEEFYKQNAEKLKEDLDKLDKNIKEVVDNSESKTIISGGHFAFGYFADRYGLEYISPYEGFSPNAEPSAQAIANIMKIVKETDAKAIFYEELVDPKISKRISEQTGIEMLELNAAHNVSKEQLESGIHYLDIMYKNLENLKKVLVIMNKLIEAHNLNVNYGDEKVLIDVSFTIYENDFIGLVGENGSGKTTLVKALLGIIPSTSGSIDFIGNKSRITIGYLPQILVTGNIKFPALVHEIVGLGLIGNKKYPKKITKSDMKKIEDTLTKVGAIDLINKRIGDLSGGQQQKGIVSKGIS